MTEYKYLGVELTPTIFEELLIERFDGKQFSRQNALEDIINYHKSNGGITKKKEYVSVFKKACQRLKDNGLTNIGYGIWRLNFEKEDVEIIPATIASSGNYVADKTIGEGSNSIYVYYYDVYKEIASLKGSDFWECKIGRTDKDPLQRVFSQAGTCYPEEPHLALIINCKDSSLLESAIHYILKVKGRWIEKAPGTEWFLTNPLEVEAIYLTIITD